MKILVCNANTTDAVTQACAAAARATASAGTEIIAATPRFGPKVIATRVENALAAHGLLDALAEHAGGCDAAILAVSYDTALDAARQLLPIPVIGMTEAACLVACTLSTRFGLATFNNARLYREVVAGHGLSDRLVSVHVTGGQATDIFSDPAGTTARLLAAIERCVADGAEAVILGGAALAGQVPHLQPKAPVPLLDGIACATAVAELRVRLGVPASRAGALALPPRDSTNLSAPLAARLLGRA